MHFFKSITEKFLTPKIEIQKEIVQEKKLQGIIGFLELEDLWYSLTKEEQDALTRYEQEVMGADKEGSLITGDYNFEFVPCVDLIDEHSKDKINIHGHMMFFVSNKINWGISDNNYSLVDKLICYIEEKQPAKENLILWHYYWQDIAEYYYKLREIRANAIELSINYCLKDIEHFPNYIEQSTYYLEKLGQKNEPLPFIKTFYRLMIIYEKQGRYEEAIKYCEMAINYGLEDNTKGGYKARLERLKKKLNK